VKSCRRGTVLTEQLVCELLALVAGDVVLSAGRQERDIGGPADTVNALGHAGFVVEVQDVVLLALPSAL
jgi:hypothetical protein